MKLLNVLKKKMKRVLYGSRCDSESFIRHLRSVGMRIGTGVTIFGPDSVVIDASRPWMIEIGNNVQITAGVTILTHGFDWSVLKGVSGEILGSSGKVTIGDNVFVGTKATILKGVHIGNNAVIAAGSVVTSDIPDNCVVAGVPARPIMTIQEYYDKRKAVQYAEAAELVREYRVVYGKDPGARELSEFFWLFTDGSDDIAPRWKYQMKQAGNEEQSYRVLAEHKKPFESMQEFLRSVD